MRPIAKVDMGLGSRVIALAQITQAVILARALAQSAWGRLATTRFAAPTAGKISPPGITRTCLPHDC
jgi:hypothetical protein